VRANRRAIPVFIQTARGSWAERVDGIDAGADDYLPELFRMEELLTRRPKRAKHVTKKANHVDKNQPCLLPDMLF
jgi:DNA-binding response OmpR family regulator